MLYHLADLEADFRAFYRLTPADVVELSGPHFLSLAYRTTAYSGAMAAQAARAEDESKPQARTGGKVESTPAVLQHDAVLSDLIDYG